MDPIAARSAIGCRLFTRYLRWFAGRHFHAIRVSRDGLPDVPADGPVIVCTNHPSWWDPAIFFLLMQDLFPGRQGFGPMDEAALARYGFFRRLGIFGISLDTPRGAADFLRTGLRVLQTPNHMLWITAQGAFTDAAARPVRLRPGIAHLARRADRAVILPLALEYPFWNERLPEMLVRFGPPIVCGGTDDVGAWTVRLEAAMTETMDALRRQAISRDPAQFRRLMGGGKGVGGVYDLQRRLRAWARGRRFTPDHSADREEQC